MTDLPYVGRIEDYEDRHDKTQPISAQPHSLSPFHRPPRAAERGKGVLNQCRKR